MYKINEIEKILDIPSSTLRFYEKEGILPKISRDDRGQRIYSEQELEWLHFVVAFKETGMPLETIKEYITCVNNGDETVEHRRRQILIEHKKHVEEKLAQTLKHLEKITLYDVLILKKDPLSL